MWQSPIYWKHLEQSKTVLLKKLSEDDVLRMLTIPQCRICSLCICYHKIKIMKVQYVISAQYIVLKETEETWLILKRQTVQHAVFLRKYKDK
jgi:hypothetical protein